MWFDQIEEKIDVFVAYYIVYLADIITFILLLNWNECCLRDNFMTEATHKLKKESINQSIWPSNQVILGSIQQNIQINIIDIKKT